MDRGSLLWRLNPPWCGKAAVPRVEVGKSIRSIHDHRPARGIKILQRLADITDGFCAGAHDGDGMFGEGAQVRGDIPRPFGAQVDTADTTGGGNGDAGKICDRYRR